MFNLNPNETYYADPKLTRRLLEIMMSKIDKHLVGILHPLVFEIEQYRLLRNRVEQLCPTDRHSIIAVSSPGVGDGKTTTAINLAGAMAQTPKDRVLLVDADLRVPSIMDYIGMPELKGPGLADLIVNPSLTLEKTVRYFPAFNLSVLPAGGRHGEPYELLKSPRLGILLEEARQQFDWIVLDTSPIIPVSDCQLVSRWVDHVLLVVLAHRTPRKMIEEALDIMGPDKIGGLIFNCDDSPTHQYYGDYYGHFENGNAVGRWRRLVRKLFSPFRGKHPSETVQR